MFKKDVQVDQGEQFLNKTFIYPDIAGDAQAVKNANYSQSLTAEELKQTEGESEIILPQKHRILRA